MKKTIIFVAASILLLILTTKLYATAEKNCLYDFNDDVNIAYTNLEGCYSECWLQINGWCDWECETIFDLQVNVAIQTYNDCTG